MLDEVTQCAVVKQCLMRLHLALRIRGVYKHRRKRCDAVEVGVTARMASTI